MKFSSAEAVQKVREKLDPALLSEAGIDNPSNRVTRILQGMGYKYYVNSRKYINMRLRVFDGAAAAGDGDDQPSAAGSDSRQ